MGGGANIIETSYKQKSNVVSVNNKKTMIYYNNIYLFDNRNEQRTYDNTDTDHIAVRDTWVEDRARRVARAGELDTASVRELDAESDTALAVQSGTESERAWQSDRAWLYVVDI